jgi:hypothetical protein
MLLLKSVKRFKDASDMALSLFGIMTNTNPWRKTNNFCSDWRHFRPLPPSRLCWGPLVFNIGTRVLSPVLAASYCTVRSGCGSNIRAKMRFSMGGLCLINLHFPFPHLFRPQDWLFNEVKDAYYMIRRYGSHLLLPISNSNQPKLTNCRVRQPVSSPWC